MGKKNNGFSRSPYEAANRGKNFNYGHTPFEGARNMSGHRRSETVQGPYSSRPYKGSGTSPRDSISSFDMALTEFQASFGTRSVPDDLSYIAIQSIANGLTSAAVGELTSLLRSGNHERIRAFLRTH